MMRLLTRIELSGFKSVREADLTLGPLNVLIGANGSGKSNFVSVFEFFRHSMEGDLDDSVGKMGGADCILHYGQKTTNKLVIEMYASRAIYKGTWTPGPSDRFLDSSVGAANRAGQHA